jgi:hypothetical protein
MSSPKQWSRRCFAHVTGGNAPRRGARTLVVARASASVVAVVGRTTVMRLTGASPTVRFHYPVELLLDPRNPITLAGDATLAAQ